MSKARRKQILETLQAHPYKVAPRIATIWVESVVNNPKLVEEYIHGFSSISPDYLGIDDAASKKDFKKRIGFFKQHYEHITDEELGPEDGYVKLTNSGRYTCMGYRFR